MKSIFSIDWLKQNSDKKFLLFYGQQKPDGKINKGCLSQWFERPFVVDNITYKSAEHWMMANKASLFGDDETREEILNVFSPQDAKGLGRKVKNFDSKVWEENSFDVVVRGNFHKFSQNADLSDFLLNTGDDVLVEASPYDKIWGIGLSSKEEDALDVNKWQGTNFLGFALMEVRIRIKNIKEC